jgi:hypothetical protein
MILRRTAVAALFAVMDGLWRIAAAKKSYNITSSGRSCLLSSSSRLRGGTATIGEAVSRDIVVSPRHKSCLALKRLGLR